MFIERSEFRVVPVLGLVADAERGGAGRRGEVAAVERISVAELADPANRLMLRFPAGAAARRSASAGC